MQTRSTRSSSFQRALLLFLLVAFAGATTGCSQLPREHWWQFWRKKPTTTSSVYTPDSVTVPPPPDAAGRNPGASALSPDGSLPAPPGGVRDSDPLRQPAMPSRELRTIHFPYDSDQITAENEATLNANAEYLKANPSLNISIEGHTDERGTTEYNLSLGDRRAKAVKAYLMAKGVQGERLHTTSYGKERPADAGHSESSYARNRRAQFLVY